MGRTDYGLLGHCIDDGRLQFVQVLGSGSSGVVYLAKDRFSSTRFAVKCMNKSSPDTVQFAMQQREIQHHRLVSSHPNILTLHRVIEEGPYVYLVLDYCRGGDMFKFISEGGTFTGDDDEVKRIFLQLVDAVYYCHKRGVYHRDIKPENIICSADRSKVFLGDFGLSTMSSRSANFCVGSYSYMSPGMSYALPPFAKEITHINNTECLHFDVLTETYSCPRNDVWALGVILTSMISGRNPWRYATQEDGCWDAYLKNHDFLRTMLPISEAANSLLRDIFTTSEQARISIADLRTRIVDMDTFFMTPAEINKANEQVQKVAASYFRSGSPYLSFQQTSSSYGDVVPSADTRRRVRFRYGDNEHSITDSYVSDVQDVPRSELTNPTNADELSNSDNSHGPRTPPPVYMPPQRQDDCMPVAHMVFNAPAFPLMSKNVLVDRRTSYHAGFIRRILGRFLD